MSLEYHLIDFKKLQVGEEVWSYTYGPAHIQRIFDNGFITTSEIFPEVGKYAAVYGQYLCINNICTDFRYMGKHDMIFKSNPFKQIETNPKEGDIILVKNYEKWVERILIHIDKNNNALFICDGDEKSYNNNLPYNICCHNEWKLPELPTKEYSMDEIAEKLGIDVSQLKIKK